MPTITLQLALLAERLARVARAEAVVCLGCRVAGTPGEEPLLTLARSPFAGFSIDPDALLLVVVPHSPAGLELARACARRAVPEAWLFDEADGWLERLSLPAGGRYRRRSLLLPGEEIVLSALPAIRFAPLVAP